MHISADWCLLTLQGLAKNVGVSNMSIKKMQDVLKYAKVRPKRHTQQTLSASVYWQMSCLLAPAGVMQWRSRCCAVMVQMLRCLQLLGWKTDGCHCGRRPMTAWLQTALNFSASVENDAACPAFPGRLHQSRCPTPATTRACRASIGATSLLLEAPASAHVAHHVKFWAPAVPLSRATRGSSSCSRWAPCCRCGQR